MTDILEVLAAASVALGIVLAIWVVTPQRNGPQSRFTNRR